MKITKGLLFFLLVCLAAGFGCNTPKARPVAAEGPVSFGPYEFTPPKGYLYYPREFTEKIDSNSFFLVSFFADMDSVPNLKGYNKPEKVFFNFGVFKNEYKDMDDYYQKAGTQKLKYKPLPPEAEDLDGVEGWSCKVLLKSSKSIECFRFSGDHLVSFSAVGFDEKKVYREAHALKEILLSYRENRAASPADSDTSPGQ